MAKFLKWVKSAVETMVDPEKQQRVDALVRLIQSAMQSQRRAFSLWRTLSGQHYTLSDLNEARDRIYRNALERGWANGNLEAQERASLAWIVQVLEIPHEAAQGVNHDFARRYFAATLNKALQDGNLDRQGLDALQSIVASVNLTVPAFARMYFSRDCEALLRRAFEISVSAGRFSQAEWSRLVTTAQWLGLEHGELLAVIHPQAQQLVEHVLADAKNDGLLTPLEEGTLNWLIANLGVTEPFAQYVQGEIRYLKALTEIENCRLPSIGRPAEIETRSGEIVHAHLAATWRETRMRKSGPQMSDHVGTLTFTDNRLIFSSVTKSQNVNYRKIVTHRGSDNWIQIQVAGQAVSTFYLREPSRLTYPILRMAIAMANQTRVAAAEGQSSRHIPRDVRQRVFQRCGGRCVECNATEYLEYDHIIPVARGGGNSDNNIQLLCRRCNLKKSDNI